MNKNQLKTTPEKPLIFLVGIFISGLTIASILASKIINVYGLYVPAGVLAYSITFMATDTIAEIWGKAKANWVVLVGFISLLVVLVLINIAISLPAAPFWKNQVAFDAILHGTRRIIIASFIAYLISQFHDVWAFHLWKRITQNKYLWLRNNLSTMVSQLLDTVIFITIAFYGLQPIGKLIWGQYVVKLGIAVVDTPFVYLIVYLIRKDRY
ncbi:MAG: queuosine precursor transporter [bacterium]|nr:MAG: queuosine precursor transporter [bacterium]